MFLAQVGPDQSFSCCSLLLEKIS